MATVRPYHMARPKGRNGKPKRLYLNEQVTSAADKFAFQRDGSSLSAFVEELIIAKLKKHGVTIPTPKVETTTAPKMRRAA